MDYPLYNPTNKSSSSSSSSSSQIMNSSISSTSHSRKLNTTTTTSNYGKKKGYKGGVKLSTDPQSVAARERRHRISDRFKILQSLVPGGAKLDTVSMLEHTIEYVKFLKSEIWLHQAILNNNNINNKNNNSYYTYDQYDHSNYNYNYSSNFNKYEPQYSHEMMWYDDNSNYNVFCHQEEGGGLGGNSVGFRSPEVNMTGVAPHQATLPIHHVQGFSYSYHGNEVDQMMYCKRSLEY